MNHSRSIPEELIKVKANKIWKKRQREGRYGTPESDWSEAKKYLEKHRWEVFLWRLGEASTKLWELIRKGIKLLWRLLTFPFRILWNFLKFLLWVFKPLINFFWKTLPTSDWVKLLAAPVALSLAGAGITARFQEENRQNETINKYFEQVEKLVVDKNIDLSKTDDVVRTLIKARSLATLRSIDLKRKEIIISFLSESNLLNYEENGISLSYFNLSEINLSGFNLIGINFKNTFLLKANLEGANLRAADLEGANLEGANLRAADLRDAKLIDADLGGANLRAADLRDAKLRDADLEGAELSSANLEGAYLGGAELSSADLEGAYLSVAILQGAELSSANLFLANLRDADLSSANLRDADLGVANLIDADLEGANLEGADLRYANLFLANLEGADLRDAKLVHANLVVADLEGAYLEGAYLSGAELRYANLEGAYLNEVENLTSQEIKSACNWEKAIYRGEWSAKKNSYVAIEPDNTNFIEDLKKDKSSDPDEPVDCSFWKK